MVSPKQDQPVAPAAVPAPSTFSNVLASTLDTQTKKARTNTTGMQALLHLLAQQEELIRQGGGPKAIDSQHAKKRLTVRERLERMIDRLELHDLVVPERQLGRIVEQEADRRPRCGR